MSQSAVVRTPEVLASIAQELEHAGELCDRLETLVTQLVRASRGEPLAIALHEAQTLDVLTQHLAALATFTRKLSAQAESDAPSVATSQKAVYSPVPHSASSALPRM